MSTKKEVTPEVMQAYAKLLDSVIPEGYGFTLFVFETNVSPSKINYISSTKREDMKAGIREMLNKWDAVDNIKKGFNSN